LEIEDIVSVLDLAAMFSHDNVQRKQA